VERREINHQVVKEKEKEKEHELFYYPAMCTGDANPKPYGSAKPLF